MSIETEITNDGGKLKLSDVQDSDREKFNEAKAAYQALRPIIEDQWDGLTNAQKTAATRDAILLIFDGLKWMWKAGDWD